MAAARGRSVMYPYLEVVGDTDSFILIRKITNYEGDKRKKSFFFFLLIPLDVLSTELC